MRLDRQTDSDAVVDRSREIAEKQWGEVESALDKDRYVPGGEWEACDAPTPRFDDRASSVTRGPVGA
jgi:hypothetical protein